MKGITLKDIKMMYGNDYISYTCSFICKCKNRFFFEGELYNQEKIVICPYCEEKQTNKFKKD